MSLLLSCVRSYRLHLDYNSFAQQTRYVQVSRDGYIEVLTKKRGMVERRSRVADAVGLIHGHHTTTFQLARGDCRWEHPEHLSFSLIFTNETFDLAVFDDATLEEWYVLCTELFRRPMPSGSWGR